MNSHIRHGPRRHPSREHYCIPRPDRVIHHPQHCFLRHPLRREYPVATPVPAQGTILARNDRRICNQCDCRRAYCPVQYLLLFP